MRIALALWMPGEQATLNELLAAAQRAERAGFAAVWVPGAFGLDALTLLTLVGRETGRVELGTFVVPTYPRHPTALAQQALTVQAATGNRLTLGIGLSHRVVIEDMFGLDYSQPIPHLREYLTVLGGLLIQERTVFQGAHYRVAAQLTVPGAAPPPVLVAALGPAMLRLCGRLADGAATFLGGLAYLRDVAVPTLQAAAARAGRPAPRIVAGVPICVTDDPAAARAAINRSFAVYGRLPSYRATLDRGGAAGPGDVAIVGSEHAVEAQLQAFAAVGVTDLNAYLFPDPSGSIERTYALLAGLGARHA